MQDTSSHPYLTIRKISLEILSQLDIIRRALYPDEHPIMRPHCIGHPLSDLYSVMLAGNFKVGTLLFSMVKTPEHTSIYLDLISLNQLDQRFLLLSSQTHGGEPGIVMPVASWPACFGIDDGIRTPRTTEIIQAVANTIIHLSKVPEVS